MGGSDHDGAPHRRSVLRTDLTEWRSAGGRWWIGRGRRVARRYGARTAVAATLVTGAAVAVGATWATTAIYDAVAGSDGVERVDVPVLHAAMRLRSPAVDAVAALIAAAFGPVGMPVLTLAAGTVLSRAHGDRSPLRLLAAAATGSLLMTLGGKRVVQRHRPPRRDAIPPYETSPSFPSGHTLNATAIVGAVAYLTMLEERSSAAQVGTAAGATAVIGTVGMSRVLLGAHWFTDVLCGWAMGAGWLSVVVTASRLRLTLHRDRARP